MPFGRCFSRLGYVFPFRGKWNPVRCVVSSHHFLPPCIRLHGWKCGQSDHLSCAAFKRTYERSNLKTYESYGPGKVGSGGRFPWRRISDQFTLFIHPEVCVDDSSFISLLKSHIYQKRVKCVVVDGAHLIKELFKCGLTYIKKLTKWVIIIINTCFD